jgi:hypothetical protein
VTRVEGYSPMFGELELREVFGPRFTRVGELIEESPVGGGPGVPPSTAPETDGCESAAGDPLWVPAAPVVVGGWRGVLSRVGLGTGRRLV